MVTMSEIIQQAIKLGECKVKLTISSSHAGNNVEELKECRSRYNAAEQVLREMVEMYKKQ